jgi:uncharacterized Zn-binding protein involved in type VI secretion
MVLENGKNSERLFLIFAAGASFLMRGDARDPARKGADQDEKSGTDDALMAPGFRAGVRDAVVLAVEAEDEHGAAVHFAAGLVRVKGRGIVALGGDVTDPFAKAAATEFVSATKKVDGVVGAIGGDAGFHGPEMLVTKGEDVRPHDLGECSIQARATRVTSGSRTEQREAY